jgi:hypothetical protein
MKSGCSGCLGCLLAIALLIAVLGSAVVMCSRMLGTPGSGVAAPTPADGLRAQRKLFDLARPRQKTETITLSEGEVTALLARHLVEVRGVRLTAPRVRLLGEDRFTLDTQRPLRNVLEDVSAGALVGVLPERWRTRPVWILVAGRVHVDAVLGRRLRADLDAFAIGRQPVPAVLLRLGFYPALADLLQWPLPDHIERIAIEPGRVVVRTVASR